MDEFVSLNTIYEELCKFRKETGKEPKTIHLTKNKMNQLRKNTQDMVIAGRAKDMKERLRPDLLPVMRQTPKINEGDYVYGLCIIECETGGIRFSSERPA